MAVSCSGKSSDGKSAGSGPAASAEPDPAKFAACTFITVKDAGALFGHPAHTLIQHWQPQAKT